MSEEDKNILDAYNAADSERALRLFADQYQSRLYSLAYRMLGNHDDAVDALQDILLQVHRSLKNFKGEASLYTWAYRLSTNVCLNFRKKRSRSQNQVEWNDSLQSALLPLERPNEDPDKMCETKYNQFLIQQAILKLPDTQRIILVLHDLEGLSVSDAAKIIDIPLSAAKARLQRGRAALRRIISSGFVVKGMEGVGVYSETENGKIM